MRSLLFFDCFSRGFWISCARERSSCNAQNPVATICCAERHHDGMMRVLDGDSVARQRTRRWHISWRHLPLDWVDSGCGVRFPWRQQQQHSGHRGPHDPREVSTKAFVLVERLDGEHDVGGCISELRVAAGGRPTRFCRAPITDRLAVGSLSTTSTPSLSRANGHMVGQFHASSASKFFSGTL